MSLPDALRAEVEAWLAADPDSASRSELTDLIVRQDALELADRFAGRLEFGTAGLRGRLGAGPNRMNRAVVIGAAAGLSAYLISRQETAGGVVVGYDARHLSHRFAEDSAAVFAAAGLRARLLPRPLPTPVLAFAVRHLGAAAGVMVTASHNPPGDNGYKVYLGDGRQIAPPADAEIAAHIAAVGTAAAVPRAEGRVETLDDAVGLAYARRAAALVGDGPRGLRVAYTPLHGVGFDVLLHVFAAAGFAPPIVVREQAEPDPDFPTVGFPNPEEPGALDLVLALAVVQDADVVLANDPDADRCAAAVPTPAGPRVLTGDEVGALLAEHLASTGRSAGTLATTIVSSSLLEKIAAAHGLPFARTLTGFKWLTRTPGLTYAYEEALGYCVDPAAVCDKDGITAALLLAELAADCASRGETLLDRLDDLARRHGVYATGALTLRVEDPAAIAAAVDRLRTSPPTALGGRAVQRVDDLRRPTDGLPPTDGVRLVLAGPGRVVVRPSGTEPKLKCYLEVVQPAGPDLAAARTRAGAELERIRVDLAGVLGLP